MHGEPIGDSGDQQKGLAPGGVDLGPVDGLVGETAETETVDRAEEAVVRDTKGVVVDVRTL